MGKLIKPTDKWGSLREIEELLRKEKDVIRLTAREVIKKIICGKDSHRS